jgi:hypothetical protein
MSLLRGSLSDELPFHFGGEEGMPLCAQRMTAVVYHR